MQPGRDALPTQLVLRLMTHAPHIAMHRADRDVTVRKEVMPAREEQRFVRVVEWQLKSVDDIRSIVRSGDKVGLDLRRPLRGSRFLQRLEFRFGSRLRSGDRSESLLPTSTVFEQPGPIHELESSHFTTSRDLEPAAQAAIARGHEGLNVRLAPHADPTADVTRLTQQRDRRVLRHLKVVDFVM